MPLPSAERPLIHPGCEIDGASFGAFAEIGAGSRVSQSVIGDYSYCDRLCDIANATVGRFSNIASLVRIGATDHPLDRASLHHFQYRSAAYWPDAADDAEWFARRSARRTVIGDDTWIGPGAQVTPGVTVGHGAVIASSAVVVRDVAPYAIVAGVPAKPLRDRLPPDLAARMVALAWRDWDHARIRAALDDFRRLSAAAFLDRYEASGDGASGPDGKRAPEG
ncbi:MAG: chloramphenicol acetyltransferase [Mangrovicoccus sp.]|nr:chloramphenicol acetyltransferase [Mangrovicoccus sp.]